jgi:hypothetical protein
VPWKQPIARYVLSPNLFWCRLDVLDDDIVIIQIKTFVWDAWAEFTTILDDPTSYGFRDAVTYGTDADLFWYNDLHPTSKSNYQIVYLTCGTHSVVRRRCS